MLIYLQMIQDEEDRSKFERIYYTYRGLMYHTAYRLLGQEQDAEDAVHQAFVKVAEHILKISEPVCPKTRAYVVTIVENQAIDMLRRRNRHPSVSFEDGVYGLPVEEQPEDTLAQCILELPAKQRQVVWLKYNYGYSLREVARMLDVSLAAAAKLDQRAKKKLEELYRERGGTL